jgi:hypothetical protein
MIRARRALGVLAASLLLATLPPMSTPHPVAAVACDPDPFCGSVTIDFDGNGSGRVVDRNDTHSIDCTITAGVETGDCFGFYSWNFSTTYNLELDETPATGSTFCTVACAPEGQPGYFQLTMYDQSDTTIDYGFQLAKRSLTLGVTGSGDGVITHEGDDVCPASCLFTPAYGTEVHLEAIPADDSVFDGWNLDGPCAGQDEACQFAITGNVSVTARFVLPATPRPSVSPTKTPGTTTGPGPTKTPGPASTPGASQVPVATSPGGSAGEETGQPSVDPGPSGALESGEAQTVSPGIATSVPSGPTDPIAVSGLGGTETTSPLLVVLLALALALGLVIGGGIVLAVARRRRPPAA